MEFKSFTPDPRRIHGDPRPSTPFSHFRGNVRQKKSEKKDRIISLSPHRDDDLSFICADEKFEIPFDEPYSLLFDRSRKEKEKKVSLQKNSRGELNSLGWRTHAPQDFTFPLSRVFSFSRARPSGIRADLYLHLDWISYFPTASLEHRLDYADFWTGRERMHVTFAFPPPAPFLLRRNSGFLVAEDIRERI